MNTSINPDDPPQFKSTRRNAECLFLMQWTAPVYDWFTEGFDTADLKDAKALLDELA